MAYTKEERERQAIQAMQERLDYLRDQLLVGENISYAELAELLLHTISVRQDEEKRRHTLL